MPRKVDIEFGHADLLRRLAELDDRGQDPLDSGLIGLGKAPDAIVVRHHPCARESSGLDPKRVVGLPLFSVVAQCMNNDLVALRFDDVVAAGQPLDARLDFTFTLRMKPTPVRLRLLSAPDQTTQFIAVLRQPQSGLA